VDVDDHRVIAARNARVSDRSAQHGRSVAEMAADAGRSVIDGGRRQPTPGAEAARDDRGHRGHPAQFHEHGRDHHAGGDRYQHRHADAQRRDGDAR
jgi:hypothetical protein